jgi:hypothetical protein
MGVRSAFLFVIVLLIAALAALNWGALSTPSEVWLGFMTVTAPLGLIMLGLTVVLAAFFLVYVLYLHSSVLMDTKRHTKEMQVQRDLADKAEASRFTELRNFLEAQENKHMAQNADRQAAVLARLDQLETAVRLRSDQTDNTVAAHIGQLEDRIERVQHRALAGACPTRAALRFRVEGELGLHAARVARRRRLPADAALGDLGFGHVQLQHQLVRVDGDRVAFVDEGDGAAGRRFGRHVADHHAPGAAGEAAVGDQAHALAQARADQRAGGRQHLGHAGPPLGPR